MTGVPVSFGGSSGRMLRMSALFVRTYRLLGPNKYRINVISDIVVNTYLRLRYRLVRSVPQHTITILHALLGLGFNYTNTCTYVILCLQRWEPPALRSFRTKAGPIYSEHIPQKFSDTHSWPILTARPFFSVRPLHGPGAMIALTAATISPCICNYKSIMLRALDASVGFRRPSRATLRHLYRV
jgi:hypothetical protein